MLHFLIYFNMMIFKVTKDKLHCVLHLQNHPQHTFCENTCRSTFLNCGSKVCFPFFFFFLLYSSTFTLKYQKINYFLMTLFTAIVLKTRCQVTAYPVCFICSLREASAILVKKYTNGLHILINICLHTENAIHVILG